MIRRWHICDIEREIPHAPAIGKRISNDHNCGSASRPHHITNGPVSGSIPSAGFKKMRGGGGEKFAEPGVAERGTPKNG